MDVHTETAPPAPRRRRRRLNTWLALVVVIGGALALYFTIGRDPAPSTPHRQTEAEAAAQITVPESGPAGSRPMLPQGLPNGCLGGADPWFGILIAQRDASLSDNGAAEFALAVSRWTLSLPHGPDMTAQIEQVMTEPQPWLDRLAAQNSSDVWRLVNPDTWRHVVISNDGEQATVVVAVDAQNTPIGNETPAVRRATIGWVLAERDGHWTVLDTQPPAEVPVDGYFGACA